jgi:hypothetical protein
MSVDQLRVIQRAFESQLRSDRPRSPESLILTAWMNEALALVHVAGLRYTLNDFSGILIRLRKAALLQHTPKKKGGRPPFTRGQMGHLNSLFEPLRIPLDRFWYRAECDLLFADFRTFCRAPVPDHAIVHALYYLRRSGDLALSRGEGKESAS